MVNGKIPKILIISARADFGGGPEHIYRLIQNLKDEIEFYIACPNDYPYWNRYESLVRAERMIVIPHRKFKLNTVANLIFFLQKHQIDVIHSHGKGAGVYGRTLRFITGIPCVHTFHGIHVGEYNNMQKSVYVMLEKLMSRITASFITVSKSEFDLVKKLKIARDKKINIINNGVVIPIETVEENIFSREKLKLITISRFDYSKNTLLLIDILKELKKQNQIERFETIILGSGQDEKIFKQKLEQNRISSFVNLLGMVDNPSDYLKDTFCYISTSRWEGLPLGILEAMAIGIPAIATNVTGNKDVVQKGVNGFLYDLDKPEIAADYLLKLSGDKEMWKNFSQASRKIVEKKFSVEKMAAETKKVYSKFFNK